MKSPIRAVAVAALLCVPAVAAAQAYQPEIAYTASSGSSVAIFVANADGSRPVKIYQGPSKTSVGPVDIAPGGGRLAFFQAGSIRTMTYTATAGGVTPGPVTTLVAANVCSQPDFSPDGTRLLYTTCGPGAEIRTVPVAGGAPTTVLAGFAVDPRWLASGTRIVWKLRLGAAPWTYDLLMGTLDPDGTITQPVQVLFTTALIDSFDTARNYDAVVVTGTSPSLPSNHLYEYDVGCGTFTYLAPVIYPAHYTADDAALVYSDRTYLYRFGIDTGTTTRLTPKRGSYAHPDTAPPATVAFQPCPG